MESSVYPAARGLSADGLYRITFEQHPQPMWVYDAEDLTLIAANSAAQNSYGFSPDDIKAMRIFDLHPAGEAESAVDYYLDVRGTGSRRRGWTHVRKDGTAIDVETTIARLTGAGVEARLLIAEDVTERNRAERALRESKQRYRALVGDSYEAICLVNAEGKITYLSPALHQGEHPGGVDDWVFEIDGEGRFRYCSPAIERMIGYKPEEVLGHPFYDFYFPESREKVRQFFSRLMSARTGWTDLVQRLRHKDGSECFVESSAVPRFDDNGRITGFRGSDRDVTSRTKFEQRVRYGSRQDPLTGLPNRIFFQERLASVLARVARNGTGEAVAVLFIDLDHFKLINDTFGHAVGDNALQVIASMVRSIAGDEENVARVGGDELTVFLPGVADLDEAKRVARRIFDAIAIPLALDGNQIHVSATIGIAMSPCDGDSSAALVRNAEHAMHRAKELGRSRIQHFTPEMREEQAQRMALESDLRRALDRGEMLLHYQPLYDATTWEMVGVEALIRWQHPTRGLLLPDAFIGIAERSGAIVPVGAWALRQACIDVQRLQAKTGRPLRVAVNLSARQLQEPELIDTVREIVETTGLDPHLLELEITESVAMQNAEATLATLRALKYMGVSLAVDDFGTGFSSLLYLTRFPIDTVKVDRQFVWNVTTDESAAAVVGAIVALAHSLHLKTVAEGVETVAQREFLSGVRCEEMQGWLFARAVPLGELLGP